VTGLVTEPGAKTMRFNLWGFTLPSREWEVITVDFENVLTRACKFLFLTFFLLINVSRYKDYSY